MGNEHYWQNKEERARQAKLHTVEMGGAYAEEIKHCVDNSLVYRSIDTTIAQGEPEFILTDKDTVSQIFASDYKRAVALNFASYKNPGGGFLKGSSAQEESLCMESYLYNVLKEFPTFYAQNGEHLNRGLYTDAAIYTPSILFIRNQDIKYCDVLTCAAPNRSLGLKYGNFSLSENTMALRRRTQFIRNIIESLDIDTAILGAWGCGVFMQDPEEVARVIKEEFSKTSLEKVILAVPNTPHSRENYLAFERVFVGK